MEATTTSGGSGGGSGGNVTVINTPGVYLTDPITNKQAYVSAFHNSDNQILSGTSYGLLTGGVGQTINATGGLDRQRETGLDGITAVGVVTGTQQLASPISGITTSQAITLNANAQTVNVSGLTFSARGQTISLGAGSVISIDVGANAENVVLTAVGTNTITGVFTKNHSTSAAITSFAYNQARDATILDGAPGTGIAANATFLLNANGGWEAGRSASGELDGASGAGTSVAAEYEYNGGGPHGNFDRARSIQGKYPQTLALASAPATGQAVATLSASAPASLQVGMSVILTGGTAETLAIKAIAGTSITFTTNILNASHTGLFFESFASYGPGLTGFSPLGMGIEEEAVFDPVSGLFYLERSATQDGVAVTNVVMETPALFNGATADRQRGNVDTGALVTLSAASAGGNSADQTNYNGRGLQLGINITAITGTSPTSTVTVQGKDTASGQYYTLLQSTALAAVGYTNLSIYPGLTAAANSVANQLLPRTFRILYAIGGTTPAITATIGASVIV